MAKVAKYECSFPPLLTVSHRACRHCPSLQEALPSLSCLRFPNTCLDQPVFLCVFAIHRQRDVRDSGGSFAAGTRDKGCYDVVHGGKMGFVLKGGIASLEELRRSPWRRNPQQATSNIGKRLWSWDAKTLLRQQNTQEHDIPAFQRVLSVYAIG